VLVAAGMLIAAGVLIATSMLGTAAVTLAATDQSGLRTATLAAPGLAVTTVLALKMTAIANGVARYFEIFILIPLTKR
jgi:hypothetical protein